MSRKNYARLLCSAAVIALAGGTTAWADDANFSIAPQSLDTALNAFSEQSAHPVLFKSDMALAKRTNGITGAADPEVALNQLLQGTGLTWKRAGDTFVITDASDPQSGSAAGDGADAGTVQALIVTAQKREENIQDVPIAMSAFTQEDLTRSQVAGGPDLMTQVPNFTFTKTNFSGYSIQIRGIGTQAVSATVDPAVAVAFNNTPFIRNRFFEQEFYDLERVEVLRGPQGTLYGRNATAGVVNIISAKPKDHFEARLSADVANYNSSRLEGMINIPLVEDKAALRIAGAWTKRDGYVKNLITGQQTDGRNLWSVRVTLGLTPTDWFKANLIYERFTENDDRLRSGKQLCRTAPTPNEIDGVPIALTGDPLGEGNAVSWSQGCLPASLYSPDSFQVPNGFALPYGPAASLIGAPISLTQDPYTSATQSRNLREIETRIKPDYEATNDTVELQLQFDLTKNLTLTSETGFNRDFIFSFEDFNRFNTTPGIFIYTPGLTTTPPGIINPDGTVCDPQLGCSDRMTAGDLSTAKSRQFSQEFRVSSNYDGSVNFSVGANFLRYDTEDKYYVFFNTLSPTVQGWNQTYWPGHSPGTDCFAFDPNHAGADTGGYAWTDPNRLAPLAGFSCAFIDTNDIHHLNDLGRNYFLSKNPYHLLSYAVFGELYWQVTPALKVTTGLRWTDDRKQAPQIPSWIVAGRTYGLPTRKVIDQEWREPTGRLAIDWKPTLPFTDETLLYASYVRGYKAGGANPPGYIVVAPPITQTPFVQSQQVSLTHPETFKPEFVNAYEVGTKNTLLEGRLTFNLNAFYYDYTGYQISQIVDRSAVNLNFDTKIWGSELELDWRPLENLRLGFKGGYENTSVGKGQSAIDLMDRTAGHPGWVVEKPFPTVASNCIVPEQYAFLTTSIGESNELYGCFVYLRPDLLPYTAPNNGEGFTKDLSGHELPNAPKFTTTITADFTIPLPNDWLATLHADLYRQSEAWTRIFNTPGYDKLKAYNNVNLAAIFSNEDRGWQVMAYVKNVINKDNITGAFLNSDDTGLTTNVFLNEPRLFGLRVTKNWSGGSPLDDLFTKHTAGEPYPFRLELDGDYSRFGQGHERLPAQYLSYFNADFPHHDDAQSDLDWGSSGGVKFTYAPNQRPWNISASVRYGRARGQAQTHAQQMLPDVCISFPSANLSECVNPSTGAVVLNGTLQTYTEAGGKYNYYDAVVHNQESHVNADFMVGRDFGLGSAPDHRFSSGLSGGLAFARLTSSADLTLHARPDLTMATEIVFPPTPPFQMSHVHRLAVEMQARRQFEGAGPSFKWDGSAGLFGDPNGAGRVNLDAGLGGAVLFGKQKTHVREHLVGRYTGGIFTDFSGGYLTPLYETTLKQTRDKNAIVPAANANLGLSYELGGLKVSGGYRWERYFKAIDAGIETRKTYDRQFDGPYFKVSLGFGG